MHEGGEQDETKPLGDTPTAPSSSPKLRIVQGTPVAGRPPREKNEPPMTRKSAVRVLLSRFPEGTVIDGRYVVGPLIAKGGMGCVFLGEQRPLGRKVALKVLLPQSHDPAFQERFRLEAEVSARLSHRNIVTVYDFGEAASGEAYMVMEFLDGLPLSSLLAKDGPLPLDRALSITQQVARALRAAHRAGVVHRDLKPSNVMITPDDEDSAYDRVHVLDFGLVKVFQGEEGLDTEDPELTRSGLQLGSPRYMSPEQITCGAIDPRTDVYALGTILFEALTGRSPYLAPTTNLIMQAHLMEPIPSALDAAPDRQIPVTADIVIGRCLAKRPQDRYPSMDEVLDALDAVEAEQAASLSLDLVEALDECVHPIHQPAFVETESIRPVRSNKQWPWAAALAVTGVALLLLG